MSKRGCGCIIYNNEEKILLGLRCKPGDKQEWCLPGGTIERNETPTEGVIREVKEETNIDAEIVQYITITAPHRVLSTRNAKTGWTDFIFEAREWEGKPQAQKEEFSALIWVTVEEAKGLELYPDTAAALYALRL